MVNMAILHTKTKSKVGEDSLMLKFGGQMQRLLFINLTFSMHGIHAEKRDREGGSHLNKFIDNTNSAY